MSYSDFKKYLEGQQEQEKLKDVDKENHPGRRESDEGALGKFFKQENPEGEPKPSDGGKGDPSPDPDKEKRKPDVAPKTTHPWFRDFSGGKKKKEDANS